MSESLFNNVASFLYRKPPMAASGDLKNLSISKENISGVGLVDLFF